MSEDGPSAASGPGAGAFETAAICAVVFLRMVYSSAVHPPAGYFLNAAIAVLVLAMVIRAPEKIIAPGRILSSGLVLYFLAAAFIPLSVMPWASLRWFLFHIGDPLLVVLVMAAGKKSIKPIAAAMIAAAALSAAFALRQHLGGFEATIKSGLATDFALHTLREGRVFGLTFSPDMMASVMAGLIPVAAAFLMQGLARRGQGHAILRIALPGLALALFAAVLFLTRSVGGFLAAGAGVLIWLVLRTRSAAGFFRSRPAVLALAVVALLGGAVAIMFLRGGHLLDFESINNPLVRRLDNWTTAIKVWLEFPLFGAGAGEYGLAALLHRSLAGNEAKHAHNIFIESLAELGPVGFLGSVLIVLGFFRSAFLLLPGGADRETSGASDGDGLDIFQGLAAGGGAVALHSMIDFDFSVLEVSVIFWVGLGAVSLFCVEAGEPASVRGLARGRRRSILTAVLMVLIVVLLYQASGALLREKAVAMARQGDWTGARTYTEKALDLDPTSDEMWALLARSLAMTGGNRADQAEAALRRAASLNPRYPYHYRDLGTLLVFAKPAEAEKMFERSVSLYPNSLGLNVNWGRFLRLRGRYEEAEKVLVHASRCDNLNGDALYELGLLYFDQSLYDRAEKFLYEAAWAKPASGPHAIEYAKFLDRRDPARALAFLKQWDEKHPGDEQVRKWIATLEARQNNDKP